ncbi:Methenyltetrahydromethanopterin cyclohydrolase [Planctomycetes bacterium CA13]|uniref:Methenyltetrahydromethanopterin cyclohydrolase n=1 Tax=Novipirellula herctigrandis TaxID=2527986 RepID=A0A5C5YNG5_9BACT|nr:Methenyltetrahydromethanopterin cyclohydrolase [Planctomycetes bacterium CA13]
MFNLHTFSLFDHLSDTAISKRIVASTVAGASVLDAGVHTAGSLAAGVGLARLCLADRAEVTLVPCDERSFVSPNAVFVRTDDPIGACLAAQYAGWPIHTDDFFAMGSGPMRAARGREELLTELKINETASTVFGVLESDKLPTQSAIELISDQCKVPPAQVRLAIAPSSSIAGNIQVVARSIETALHKLHALKFDVRQIVSATGHAPLPPPAKPGDSIGGIGRTNDAILYGASVTLWTDASDDEIENVAANVPSNSSPDHGQPFAKIFKTYDFDFYKVDPQLFSPAVVTIHNLRSGRTWNVGQIETALLRQSFLS